MLKKAPQSAALLGDDLLGSVLKHDTAGVYCALKELTRRKIQDQYSMCALNAVLLHHDEKGLQLLLQCKVDINSRYNGNTALHTATRRCDSKVISWLLTARANIDIQDNYGNTALHYACFQRKVVAHGAGIARQLLSARANPNLENQNGLTPLLFAIENRDCALSRMLIRNYKALINVPSRFGITPLMAAAQTADSDKEVGTIRLLLSSRADTTVKTDIGATVLMFVVRKRSVSQMAYIPTLKLLLRDKFEMDLHAKDGGTLLSLSERDPPAHQLITAAIKRRRQWQRIVLLTMSIRATRDVGTFRYSILPLVRSIMTLVGP